MKNKEAILFVQSPDLLAEDCVGEVLLSDEEIGAVFGGRAAISGGEDCMANSGCIRPCFPDILKGIGNQ